MMKITSRLVTLSLQGRLKVKIRSWRYRYHTTYYHLAQASNTLAAEKSYHRNRVMVNKMVNKCFPNNKFIPSSVKY